MKKLICYFLTLQFLLVGSVFAQDDEDDIVKSTQNDILLIAGAGAAGAVIGLSTLSFVDKPSEHLPNIWTGAALGVIAGVVFVAYNSAQRGQEDLESSANFKTSERLAWHQENVSNLTFKSAQFGTNFWQTNF